MIISPVFVGGLGNRLFQLVNAIFLADLLGVKMIYKDLQLSDKMRFKNQLKYFKIEDALSGGHPSKYRITDIFDFEKSNDLQHETYKLASESQFLSRQLDPKLQENIHLAGYYFNANIAEKVISDKKFPPWNSDFRPVNVPITPYIAHIRVPYQYDNFTASTSAFSRLNSILREFPKEWTFFTNDSSKIPSDLLTHAKYVYGSEVDVYDTLKLSESAEILIMSCSTLSGWMAFLGNHKKVYCPKEYISSHGLSSISSKWHIY